jgi:predicted phosphodiesterase
MQEVRVAVISDVHGNRWVLEAVLTDIRRRQMKEVVNLGGSVYGPLDPLGTADLLSSKSILSISGNQDRLINDSFLAEGQISRTLHFTRQNLTQKEMRWLASLPRTAVFHNSIFLCHGTPMQDDEYLLEVVTRHGVLLRKHADLKSMTRSVKQQVVLCGHSHLQRVVSSSRGMLIINPGGVGLPAYSDKNPHPHSMEAGSPHARYCAITKDEADWTVDSIAVPYDWQSAAQVALRNGRPDWAKWITTGRV